MNMDNKNNNKNEKNEQCSCKIYRTCSLGVLLIILVVVGAIAFLMLFCDHKTSLHLLNFTELSKVPQQVGNSGELPFSLLLSTITDFYTNIIVVLTAFIGILSVVGFLYIKNISNKEVIKTVDDVITGEHFQAYLERIIKKVVEKHIEDDSDLADIVEKYAKLRDLSSRIEFLEKAVLNDSKIIETGGKNNGSDTTLE